MTTRTAPQAQPSAQPAHRKLTLTKETLRRLSPAALRSVAGGAGRLSTECSSVPCIISRNTSIFF